MSSSNCSISKGNLRKTRLISIVSKPMMIALLFFVSKPLVGALKDCGCIGGDWNHITEKIEATKIHNCAAVIILKVIT